MPSFTCEKKTYQVKVIEKNEKHKCNIVCIYCDRCLHQVSCNCPEYLKKNNFCKHIHLVCMKIKNGENNNTESAENEQIPPNFISGNELMSQKKVIERELRPNNSISEDDVQGCIQAFLDKLPTYNSNEHRKEILRTIRELTYRCEAISEIDKTKLPNSIQSTNKNITPQRDFTRKRKRNGSKIKSVIIS